MTTITATEARRTFYKLVDASADGTPIQITGKRHNAVLVSEEDWNAIQETLYLVSIPGMRESIIAGGKASVSKCSSKPGW